MKKILMIMFAAVLVMPVAASAGTITIVADEWCPYNCEPGSARPGFGIEIAHEVFGPDGNKVDYQILDWDTAVEETRDGRYSAIIGAYKEDAPDFIFPDEEFGISASAFFVRKGDPWRYRDLESLQGKTIGIIEGYSYGEDWDKRFAEGKLKTVAATGDTALDTLMEKLMKGKIDVILEDPFVFLLRSKELYLSDKVTMAGEAGEAFPVYIAFSPKLSESKKLAAEFSAGISKLRSSGRLGVILKKYGLSDWR